MSNLEQGPVAPEPASPQPQPDSPALQRQREAEEKSRKHLEAYIAESEENKKRRGHMVFGYPILHYDFGNPYEEFFHDSRQADWEALDALLARPWWSRTWTVQEVWHGKNAILQCGGTTLKWKTFEKAMSYQEGWDDVGYQVKETARWPRWNALKRRYGLAIHIAKKRLLDSRLSDLLWNMWDREATDPRDKVFAVLGLVGDENPKPQLQPDYTKPMHQVYREAAASVIISENSLDLLLAASGTRARDGLPTWVPDWRREANDHRPSLFINGSKMKTLLYYSGSTYAVHFHGHGYSASGKVEPVVRFDETLSVLHARGLVFDKVVEVGPPGSNALEIIRSARSTIGKFLSGGEGEIVSDVSDEQLKSVLRAGSFVDPETLRPEDVVIETIMAQRRFFVTVDFRLGIGPSDMIPGDAVSILAGCNFPMVLRRLENGSWVVVGEAYVHKYMAGEAIGGSEGALPVPDWEELSLC
ncbi:hypothetical protein B0T16DRAFT_411009 [Cercophora newfieldiana]|uniref:Uncharacterized protein n=1 Tax=Cercophora newfieldiana TaxID=92897 RepID=A0AA39YEF6_9PEZI|nr:hypothetical protein B0T16DRAFT_411009 [Cercophora newfieldiana]